ncbi:MAG: hypothetical protein ACRD10_07500, partial [Terriglobia bacterium]
ISLSTRKDGMLFGEFIGAVLAEVPQPFDVASFLGDVPHATVGEITADAHLELTEGEAVLWREPISNLIEIWSRPFREILE